MKRSTAVVGTGYWGRNLVRVFDELGALRSVCDIEPGRAEQLPVGDSVRREPGLDEVLADPEVANVVVATPAATHHALCRQALLAGKDVLVEKPLALAVADGEELVALAERLDRVLMVGHLLRYHPAVLKLGEMIAAGELGRVEYVYSNRLNLGKLRTEENILWSFAPHDVSVILALLGETPVAVSSHGEAFLQRNVSDVTLTSIEFPNNVKAHTFVSWLHPFKEQRLVVVGSEQMAVFEDSNPAEKLAAYPHRVEWHGGKIPVAVKGKRRVVEFTADEPLRVECRHFLDCCLDRIPPRTDGYEGLAVLRVLSAAEQSLREGGRVVALASPANGRARRSPRRELAERVAETVAARVIAPAAGLTAPAPAGGTQAAVAVARPQAAAAATRPAAYVHPTALVDEGVTLGPGTKVWHFSHISKGCRVGPDNVLGQNVFVADNVVTGAGCKVQNNVSLYKGVVLEDDVFCGPSCVFTNVVDPRAFIEKKAEFRPTLVKRGASIGANATVVCGNTVGSYALVGAGAVVTGDVADHALVVGVPARQRGWVCRCGERISFDGGGPGQARTAECAKCGDAYALDAGTVKRLDSGRK